MSARPVSEYEQRAGGETELLMAREIAHADGDCRVALLLLARRFDALLGINEQLTDKLAAACTAINLISEQLPAPPIPLKAAPYQHTTTADKWLCVCGQASHFGGDLAVPALGIEHHQYQASRDPRECPLCGHASFDGMPHFSCVEREQFDADRKANNMPFSERTEAQNWAEERAAIYAEDAARIEAFDQARAQRSLAEWQQ